MTCLWTSVWFHRAGYHKYALFENNVTSLWVYICRILSNGWKLSLQRITEWINLAAIALLVSAWSTPSNPLSIAIQTSLQATSFFGTFFGGIAQTAMKIATRQGRTMKDALTDFRQTFSSESLKEYQNMQKGLDRTFCFSNAVGLILSGVFAVAVYFARYALGKLFIPNATSSIISELSASLMIWTVAGFSPDAVRI